MVTILGYKGGVGMKEMGIMGFLLSSSLPDSPTQYTESSYHSLNWPVVGMEFGLGGLIGFAIGYFFKKSLKIVLFTLGFITLILVLLNQFEFVNIQWKTIEMAYSSAVEGTGGSKQILESITQWLSDRIPLGGGLVVGFFAGLKFG